MVALMIVSGLLFQVDIARAKARGLEDRIAFLGGQYDELANQREQLLKDAESYRQSAAETWNDASLSDMERRAHAKQFLSVVESREKAAAACTELMKTYDARIGRLENKRMNQLTQADRLDRMIAPALP